MQRPCAIVLWLGLLAACGGSIPDPPALDDAARRELYERADRIFEAGVLLKPSSARQELPGFDLAPLLIREAGSERTESAPAVVYLHAGSVDIQGRRHEQRTYLWASDEIPSAQGVRLTLGRDGFPAIYEVLSDSSGSRLIFVTQTLEEAAAGEFGDPLGGRRFAVERAVDEATDVVVAGVLEPGPIPLGPFVYLTRETRDVASVICRCMESRVETVLDSLEYELMPIDDLGRCGLALPPWLEQTPSEIGPLRLPAGGF